MFRKPREPEHTPLKEGYVSPVIVPNVSFNRRRYVKVYFTIAYLVTTEGI